MIDGFVGFGGSLAEILEERLELFADRIDVLESGVESGAIFFDHVAGVGESGGKIGAILCAEKIVNPFESDFQLGGAFVQRDNELAGVWSEIVDFGGEDVEIDVLPFGAVDVGPKLGLPDLPRLPVLLHTRVKDGRPRDALAALSAAFRSAVRG